MASEGFGESELAVCLQSMGSDLQLDQHSDQHQKEPGVTALSYSAWFVVIELELQSGAAVLDEAACEARVSSWEMQVT